MVQIISKKKEVSQENQPDLNPKYVEELLNKKKEYIEFSTIEELENLIENA